MGVGQVLTMPLFFASNAIYPTDIMPGWLKMVFASQSIDLRRGCVAHLHVGRQHEHLRFESRLCGDSCDHDGSGFGWSAIISAFGDLKRESPRIKFTDDSLRGLFQMAAEPIAHGRKQLVLKIGVAARTETCVERRGQHRCGHAFVNGRLDGPPTFT
jgi:hypothetical protein